MKYVIYYVLGNDATRWYRAPDNSGTMDLAAARRYTKAEVAGAASYLRSVVSEQATVYCELVEDEEG